MKEYHIIFSVMSAPNPVYVPDDETKKWAETCLEEEPDEPYTEEELEFANTVWWNEKAEDWQIQEKIESLILGDKDDFTEEAYSVQAEESIKSENFADLQVQLSNPPEWRHSLEDIAYVSEIGENNNILSETDELFCDFKFSHIQEGKGKFCEKTKRWKKYHTGEFEYGKIFIPDGIIYKKFTKEMIDEVKAYPEKKFPGIVKYMGPNVEIPWRLEYSHELCHFEYEGRYELSNDDGAWEKRKSEIHDKWFIPEGSQPWHDATMYDWKKKFHSRAYEANNEAEWYGRDPLHAIAGLGTEEEVGDYLNDEVAWFNPRM